MHVFLCDFLLDIAQNSLEAGSTMVRITIAETQDRIGFVIQDNGKGMSAEVQKRVTDPFYTDGIKHSRRKVGLGLPFVKQTSCAFSLESEEGRGTKVSFEFDLTDIDVPPLGNLPSTLLAVFSGAPEGCDVVVDRSLDTPAGSDAYQVSRSDLIDALLELKTAGSLNLARQYLEGLEEGLDGIRTEHELRLAR